MVPHPFLLARKRAALAQLLATPTITTAATVYEREGYIDDDNEQSQGETETNAADLDIGGECEVGEPHPTSEIPEYTFLPGCNPPRPDATPLEMLLTDSILDKIVEQTNLYASQYISSHDLPPRSRVHSWTKEPFTRDELHKFLSLIIVMDLVNLPTVEDHWSTTWPYSSLACSKVSQAQKICMKTLKKQ
jgi:hypothetical protein